MAAKPVVLGVTSDPHAGSTVSPCPPEGVEMDDSGKYLPSVLQSWQWDCWVDFHGWLDGIVQQHKARLHYVLNGDLVEGDHHNSSQIISRNPDAQKYVADRLFGIVTDLKPARLFVVRGTEAHTGSSGSVEESLAKQLGAERDPVTHRWSRWHLRHRIHGRLVDCQHHGRAGGRKWTELNNLNGQAWDLLLEHQTAGWPVPDLAIRSHTHQMGDSGTGTSACPLRLLYTPPWQLKTAHAHKVATKSITKLGGYAIVFWPDGQYQVLAKTYIPDPPKEV